MKRFFLAMSFILSYSLSVTATAQKKNASPAPPNSPIAFEKASGTELETIRVQTTEERYYQQLLKKEEKPSGIKMITTGAVLFSTGFVASISSGIAMMSQGAGQGGYFFIPIVGNPIMLGLMVSHGDSDWLPLVSPLLVLMMMPTVAQLTGIILLSSGLIQRARGKRDKRTAFAFTPTATPKNVGLSFTMTF
jgi:hypothetical protein